MNIHPIFVHFPIALLVIYAVFELIRFKKISQQPYWFNIKAILLILGTVIGYATLQTGDMATELITDKSLRPLIHVHEFWAQLSILIFSALSAGYLIAWVKKYRNIWKPLVWLQSLVTETPLVSLLALAGLIALFITGALGGMIVYGHQSDFLTNWVYNLFFK